MLPKTIPLAALLLAASLPLRAQDVVVRIGVVAPLTGAIAHLGKDTENGARLAIEEINREGWTVGGHRIRFEPVVQDDRADPATATTVAQQLVDQRVAAVIGHLNSGTTIAAARVYNDAGIPQIAPAATQPRFTLLGYPFVARLMATDLQQASGIAAFIVKSLQAKTVAIVDDRTAYGQGLADQVAAELVKSSVRVAAREYTNDKATDFTSMLTSIRAAATDVIVYAGADAQAGPLNRQMKQLGVRSRFIAGDGVCTGGWSELAAGTNEGFFCTQAGSARDRMPAYADFERRFKARFGIDVVAFAPYAYDAMFVLAAAMRAARSTDPKVFGPEILKARVDGVTGHIAFDAHGDNLNGSVTVYQVRNGKLDAQVP